MKKTVSCDVCGKKMPTDEAVYDVGSERDLCREHAITEEIADLERQIRSKRKWLEQTHLAEIARMERRISELRGDA